MPPRPPGGRRASKWSLSCPAVEETYERCFEISMTWPMIHAWPASRPWSCWPEPKAEASAITASRTPPSTGLSLKRRDARTVFRFDSAEPHSWLP